MTNTDKKMKRVRTADMRTYVEAGLQLIPLHVWNAVDSKGRVLNSVSGVSVEGIPVIEVQNVDASLSRRPIKEALKILSSLPESMRNSITKVTAATQDSITTELNGGDRVIVWGDSSDLKLKKAVVDKIVNDPNVIGDKHNVDVSAPLRPIIK